MAMVEIYQGESRREIRSFTGALRFVARQKQRILQQQVLVQVEYDAGGSVSPNWMPMLGADSHEWRDVPLVDVKD